MNNIMYYGKINESTDSIGDNTPDSAKAKTTGSIGYYAFGEEGTPNINKSLSRDAVSFHGYDKYNDKQGSSTAGVVFGVASLAALAIVGCGYAHKTGSINKIKNPQIKNTLTKISEPCYKLCSNIKTKSIEFYEKIKKAV